MTSTRSASWVVLRVAVLLCAALPVLGFAASVRADYALASAWLMPSIAASTMAATCFVLQYQRMIPGWGTYWKPPSWLENPLSSHQPLQWSLLVSEVLLLGGLGGAMVDILVDPHRCSWEMPTAAGMGVWLGSYLCGGWQMRRPHR